MALERGWPRALVQQAYTTLRPKPFRPRIRLPFVFTAFLWQFSCHLGAQRTARPTRWMYETDRTDGTYDVRLARRVFHRVNDWHTNCPWLFKTNERSSKTGARHICLRRGLVFLMALHEWSQESYPGLKCALRGSPSPAFSWR